MNPEPTPAPVSRWTFRPGRGATVFAVIGFALLVSLGTWQLRRRAEAASLRALGEERLAAPAFDAADPPDDPDWRRVRVTGTPDWDHLLVLPSRFMWMQPGQQWIVPVRPEGGAGRIVLVNVGWVPDDEAEPILARERAMASPRTYEGLARIPEPFPAARAEGADPAGYPRRWRGVAPGQMGEALGMDLAPFVVVEGEGIAETAEIPDRAPPVGGWRTTLPERPHGQYALTWFCLAATLVGVWLSLSVRREEV
jgi:surfeit locus 1 family protein